MVISARYEYLLYALICAFNSVAMLLAMFGEAATGSGIKPVLWPPATLFIVGLLLLALISAVRAKEVNRSGWAAAIATFLLTALGPPLLLLIAYLTFLPEREGFAASRKQINATVYVQALALLFVPWLLLLLAKATVMPT